MIWDFSPLVGTKQMVTYMTNDRVTKRVSSKSYLIPDIIFFLTIISHCLKKVKKNT